MDKSNFFQLEWTLISGLDCCSYGHLNGLSLMESYIKSTIYPNVTRQTLH